MLVLNAGNVRDIGESYKLKIRVVHETKNKNPSYAMIIGTPDDRAHAMLSALATSKVSKLFSVATIKAH